MSNETEQRQVETPTPDQAHDILHPDRKKTLSEKHLKGRRQVGAVVTSLSVLVGGAFGVVKATGGFDNNGPEPNPTPSADAPATSDATPEPTPAVTSESSPSASDIPTQTETAPTTPTEDLEVLANSLDREQFFELFSISAAEYTTPEAISDRYVELYELWMNAGGSVQFDWDLITNEEKSIADIMDTFDGPITENLFTTSSDAQSLITNIQNDIRQYAVRDFYWSVAEDTGTLFKMDYELTDSVVKDGSADEGVFTSTNTLHITDNGGDALPYSREAHNINLWLDVTRHEDVRFVKDGDTWKVDRVDLTSSENNSHN